MRHISSFFRRKKESERIVSPYFRSSKLNKLLLNDCDEGKSELESSNELVSVLIE